jgi:hypothetical protein
MPRIYLKAERCFKLHIYLCVLQLRGRKWHCSVHVHSHVLINFRDDLTDCRLGGTVASHLSLAARTYSYPSLSIKCIVNLFFLRKSLLNKVYRKAGSVAHIANIYAILVMISAKPV